MGSQANYASHGYWEGHDRVTNYAGYMTGSTGYKL